MSAKDQLDKMSNEAATMLACCVAIYELQRDGLCNDWIGVEVNPIREILQRNEAAGFHPQPKLIPNAVRMICATAEHCPSGVELETLVKLVANYITKRGIQSTPGPTQSPSVN